MASVTQQPAATAAKGKGKKSKGTKLDIDDFVDTNSFKMVDSSWADIMEDEDVIAPSHVSLPSAPKAALGPDVDLDSLPPTGPYRLSVSNLNYETNVDQLAEMLATCNISDLRLNSENGRTNGTATFAVMTKPDLIGALNMNNKLLNNRSVRIFMPGQGGGDGRYGDRDGRRGGSRGGSYVDNTPSNWRSADRGAARPDAVGGPPKSVFPPPTSSYGGGDSYGSRGSGRYGGDRDGFRQRNNDYGGGGGFGGRRDYGEGGDRRDNYGGRRDGGRDRGDRYGDGEGSRGNWGRGPPRGGDAAEGEADNWRREGPAPPTSDRSDNYRRDNRGFGGRDGDRDGAPPPSRDSYDAPRGGDQYRRSGPREDYGRDREYERPRPPAPRDEDDLYEPPGQRGGGGGGAPDDYEAPRSFAPAPREPREPRERAMSGRSDRSNEDRHEPKGDEPRRRPAELRPVIANLLADETETKPESYSSIFGGARPVDTLKREMEIEKKMADDRAARQAEKEAEREKEAAANAAGSADGTSPAGSTSGEPRARAPRGDGPPRRRENGELRGDRDHRGPRDGPRRDRYDDRNGDRRRDGGGDRRGGDGRGPPRTGDRRDGGGPRRREDTGRDIFDGARSDNRGYGGGDRRGGPRSGDYRGGEDQRHGGRTFYPNRDNFDDGGYQQRGPRFNSEGEDKEGGVGGQKHFQSSNKFAAFIDEGGHTSD